MRKIIIVMVAAGLAASLLGGTPALAATRIPTAAAENDSARAKPPKVKQVRYVCMPEGAIVAFRLRNPNDVELDFMVGLGGGDVHQTQVVTLLGKSAERVRFDGIPDGGYTILVFDAVGDTVASAGVVVDCPRPQRR